jgi:hypothetical protein
MEQQSRDLCDENAGEGTAELAAGLLRGLERSAPATMAAALPNHNDFVATLQSMDIAAHQRKQLVLDALDLTAESDSQMVAAATLRTWKRLADHLTPVVGDIGFCALFARAAHLAAAAKAVPSVGAAKSVEALFSTLNTELLESGSDIGPEDVVPPLDVFVQLLSGLIGEALTMKILASAWAGQAQLENMPGRGK